MRNRHIGKVLLVLLLANAATILFFRYFTTVDGPLHVLHASLLKAPWSTTSHAAHGFVYDSGVQRALLGDWILAALLAFATPERAHDLIMVLASCMVVVSVFAFLHVHGVKVGLSILLLAPLLFSSLLIMGLFHFQLGTALALGTVVWWKWHKHSPYIRWIGLLIGVVISVFTNRGAPFLLCLFFVPFFLFDLFKDWKIALAGDRRSKVFRIAWPIVLLLLLGAFLMDRSMRMPTLYLPTVTPSFTHDFLLRPLFLLDHTKELGVVRALGVLFLIAGIAGSFGRWRSGRKLFWHDLLIVIMITLSAISFFGNTPHGRLFIISDRAQWLALVVLVLWLVAIAGTSPGWIARIISGAALCALPLHVIRLVQAEEFLSQFEPAHNATMEACAVLAPHSLVFPVVSRPDRMLQHELSYVALRHSGVLIAPKEQLHFLGPHTWSAGGPWHRFASDPYWLMRHWRRGLPPEVDQVLFVGEGMEQQVLKHPWPSLLSGRFKQTFDNGYARIYTATTNAGHEYQSENTP